jgi:tetratricopeptide (TPR) repeat protein
MTLADAYHELGLYQRMEQMSRGTLALARRRFGEENLVVANVLGQLGDALQHLSGPTEGLYLVSQSEAVSINRQAIAMQRKLRDPDSLEEASALYHLGLTLNRPGGNAEAEDVTRAALAIRRKRLGNEHPDVARALDALGHVLRERGKLTEAKSAALEGLALRKKLFGEVHPELGRSYFALGRVAQDAGDLPAAEDWYRQAYFLHRNMRPSPHWLGAMSDLAEVLRKQGKLTEAEALRQEFVALQPDRPTTPIIPATRMPMTVPLSPRFRWDDPRADFAWTRWRTP